MGSADWMPRNLERRVEILFPVEKEELKQRVIHILDMQLKDNVKANILTKDNIYEKVDGRGKERLDSQEEFCREAMEQAARQEEVYASRTFIPEIPVDYEEQDEGQEA